MKKMNDTISKADAKSLAKIIKQARWELGIKGSLKKKESK